VSAGPSKSSLGSDSGLGPLPGGHHGLTPAQVAESQRERLLAAVAQTVARDGYGGTTVTDIVAAASVSSRAFYENFGSKEECFLAAFDAVIAHLSELISAAAAPETDWAHQVIAALRVSLRFFAAEPDLARVCIIEPVAATPAITAHFRAVVESAVPYLEAGRAERPDNDSLPESTEDSLLGGFITLASRSVSLGDPETLERRLPDLAEFILSPYLGADAAKRLAAEAAAA
jgi:AcrR family transcriptional regulator